MGRHVLIAPDSFKGTFAADEVAAAVAEGVVAADGTAHQLPIADGGEGTMAAIVSALGGELRSTPVVDPLGRPIDAAFALLPDGTTAVVEMAQASGLSLVAEGERDAAAATTAGTGELIVAAVEAGAERVIVTVGGSATTDGGQGAVQALRDAGIQPEMTVICDVETPFEDAPRVFGPQKGATPDLVVLLERRLDDLAAAAPRDPRGIPMTGCAGGLSGGLWAHFGATLVPGAPYVLDVLNFDARAREADLVITGEGSLDEQTFAGKAVGEVARRCNAVGVPCHAVVGRSMLDATRAQALGLAGVMTASRRADMLAAGRLIASERVI